MTRLPKRIALNVTEQEFQVLAEFAAKDGRTKTDVIRELIRSLPNYQPPSVPDKSD